MTHCSQPPTIPPTSTRLRYRYRSKFGINFFANSTLLVLAMSSTANIQLGDPSQGGALFLPPREIRDEIYRLLVKGRYLADKPLNQDGWYNTDDDIDTKDIDDGPDFSILRVSKILSHEAGEILYSDSVFRFVIDFNHPRDDEKVHEKLHHLKKAAPMMMNIVLDIDRYFIDLAEWGYARGRIDWAKMLERSFGPTIDLFGDLNIERHSLHLRFWKSTVFLGYRTPLFAQIFLNVFNRRSTLFEAICQRLKPLVGFHVATVEIMLERDFMEMSKHHRLDVTEQGPAARELICRITHVTREQLELTFGPGISSFKSSARKMPITEKKILRLDDANLVGFLEFHPRKYSVKESVANVESFLCLLDRVPSDTYSIST